MEKTTLLNSRFPIPVAGAETIRLAAFLRECPVGELITYDILSQEAGVNVQTEGRGRLLTARRIVQREDHMVFSPVRGFGLKRLNSEEIAVIGSTTLRLINRAAGRGLKRSQCVDNIPALSTTAQLKWYTHLSLLNTFHQISKGASIKKIENVIATAPTELATQAVLGLMLSGATKPKAAPRIEN